MCFYLQQKYSITEVQKRFKAVVDQPDLFLQADEINGFAHPNVPVILDGSPDVITTNFTWGLLPSWAKDIDFRKNTLNARIETVDEKPSFQNVTNQRCLILATAFYEWRWNDAKGKNKQKFQINTTEEVFAFAGLYSHWTNPQTGDLMGTYAIVTTVANATMTYIHNHKKRMPIILKKEDEYQWLEKRFELNHYAFPYEVPLVGFEV
jgi:putative SOS response-associated peptidase YedK